jgi:hypothetical protein
MMNWITRRLSHLLPSTPAVDIASLIEAQEYERRVHVIEARMTEIERAAPQSSQDILQRLNILSTELRSYAHPLRRVTDHPHQGPS